MGFPLPGSSFHRGGNSLIKAPGSLCTLVKGYGASLPSTPSLPSRLAPSPLPAGLSLTQDIRQPEQGKGAGPLGLAFARPHAHIFKMGNLCSVQAQ